MNPKYPEAYGTCYKTVTRRIIGVREGFGGTWFVGYIDDMTKRKTHPNCKISGSNPEIVQAYLDGYACAVGWKVEE